MATNPGEAITLRNHIATAEKAVNVTTIKKEEATNAAVDAAKAAYAI